MNYGKYEKAKKRVEELKKSTEKDKPSEDEIRETEARFKIWDISLFYRHLWLYAGVIGFLFIINMLTWHGSIWFHWPALGWGLLIFLHWIKGSKVSSRRKP